MANTFFTPEDLRNLQNEASEKYQFIRLTVADIQGRSLSKQIATKHVTGALTGNVPFAAGSLAFGINGELTSAHDSSATNGKLVPQTKCIYPVPWADHGKYAIGEILCEYVPMNGHSRDGEPRNTARKQIERLSELGFQVKSGFESEFILFKQGTKLPYTETPYHYNNVHVANSNGLFYEIAEKISCIDPYVGCELHYFTPEFAAGQQEYVFKPAVGIAAADQMFIFRDVIKTITPRYGLDANLMAMPTNFFVGSGLHFNISLWNSDCSKNLFYDESQKDQMSEHMQHWLGGLCLHAGALTALSSPTVNCYRRINSERAPSVASWGVENRLAAFRVKTSSPSGALIENRLPSGLANPYLVMAATVAAGVDGLERKLLPPTKEELSYCTHLPRTLPEALKALDEDKVIKEALGNDLVKTFVEVKYEEMKTLGYEVPVNDDENQINREWDMYRHL